MRAWGLAAALAGAVVGGAAPAAADAGPDLAAGERAMGELDYRRAVTVFQRVVARRDATARELVHAYGALVRCHVVLGGDNAARAAAVQLIELDPGARLAGGAIPPRVTRFFEEVRRQHRRTSDAAVMVRIPHEVVAGEVLDVVVQVTRGGRAVDDVQLFVMFGAGDRWSNVDLNRVRPGWTGRVRVPSTFRPEAGPFRYYAVAFAPSGSPIGGLGTSDDPMTIGEPAPTRAPVREPARRTASPADPVGPVPEPTEPDASTPITSRWWFWTGLAALVAGGVVAIVVVNNQGQVARRAGDGELTLP